MRITRTFNRFISSIGNAGRWVKKHPKEVFTGLDSVGNFMSPIASLITLKVSIDETKDEYLHYKDPTTNCIFELVRPMTNQESKEVANLVRTNERPVEDYLVEKKLMK